VRLAAEQGLVALSITDHDTVDGVREAMDAGRRAGLEIIPGLEISALPPPEVISTNGVLHVLGYLVDTEHPGLAGALSWMREQRSARNPEIVRRLNGLGIELSYEEVERHAGGGQVGRPHIARALVEKGVVSSVQEAFDRYLRTGGPAAVEKEKLVLAAAVEAIHAAGGLAVLAHPCQLGVGDGAALEMLVRTFVEEGLDGIECRYPAHAPEQTRRYRQLAARYGLVETGGSDYHGASQPEARLGLVPPVPYSVVVELKARRRSPAKA